MYKRIIAGVLSALISTSAISTGNVGLILQTSSAEKIQNAEAVNAVATTYSTANANNTAQSSSKTDGIGEVSMTAALPLEVKAGEIFGIIG